MASVIEVNARLHNAQLSAEAQKIAELLAKTVQTGIDLGYALDLGPTGEITDSLRLALTGLAAPLIAGAYRNNSKTPTDTDIKKIVTAMQAVLSFAENFSADSDHTDRLKNLSGGGTTDAAQNYLRNVYAFVPVVNAVGAFSFGQPEQKLIMEIAGRLAATVRQMGASVLGKDADIHILNALAQIYAACHQVETARIMALSEQDRQKANLSLDPVWKNFDLRLAMLEALASGIASGAGGGIAPAMPQQTPPLAQDGNPMSMFAKKPDNNPPPQQPPAPPQRQSQTPPPDSPPPSGGNPMSFFKGPPKKTDE